MMGKPIRKMNRESARRKAKASVSQRNDRNQNAAESSSWSGGENLAALKPCVGLLQFGLIWAIVIILLLPSTPTTPFQTNNAPFNFTTKTNKEAESIVVDGYYIPTTLSSPMTEYPNPLGITEEMRLSFHPVVKFPKVKGSNEADYEILDMTESSSLNQLATEEERAWKEAETKGLKRFWRFKRKKKSKYGVGKYDENRSNLYQSDLFHNTGNNIDGYAGCRSLHIGIDLDGPVGTKVYAFSDGIIHSAGYNADLGDYGNVIVVEHRLPVVEANECHDGERECRQDKVWALYGHLDGRSVKGKSKGNRVKKGQVLGRMGDIHENGGWVIPHVHFQLSMNPPDTHDMPGVVAMIDRAHALIDYPDPRLVLGPLF